MILVVADTSPIRYLVRIGEIGLLPSLYGKAILPGVVLEELQAKDGLPMVREWAQALPSWILVQNPLKPPAVSLPNLHRGEREAIALAEEMKRLYY